MTQILTMPELPDFSVHVARVNAAHGVKGEVKALCYSDLPGRMELLDEVCVRPKQAEPFVTRVLQARQIPHKSIYIVRLEGITDRNQADAIVGAEITVQASESPQLPDRTYYIYDIIGLQAVTDQGEALGLIVDVLKTGANDVYVLDGGLLVPAIAEVVINIDLAEGVVVIKPLPGMME